jgi:hypothetical protein
LQNNEESKQNNNSGSDWYAIALLSCHQTCGLRLGKRSIRACTIRTCHPLRPSWTENWWRNRWYIETVRQFSSPLRRMLQIGCRIEIQNQYKISFLIPRVGLSELHHHRLGNQNVGIGGQDSAGCPSTESGQCVVAFANDRVSNSDAPTSSRRWIGGRVHHLAFSIKVCTAGNSRGIIL